MSRKAHCTKAGQWIDQQNCLLVILCLALALPASLRAQASQLDKTFGNGGIFLGQNAGLANSTAAALTIQSDGKILIAGQFLAPNGTVQPCVVRLASNGTLDSSFGQRGVATVSLGHGGSELFTGVVVQSDAKIMVAVSSGGADDAPVLELARFQANGTLDTSFGSAGVLELARGVPDSNAIAQQSDGKILVGGGFLVARVNSDGSLDTTFGSNGFAPVISPASAISLQANGQILLPESRYNANGTVDTSFGILGRIATLGPVSPARVQSDGRIVAAGAVTSKVVLGQLPNATTITGFGLTRYNSNGSLDTSFGHQGGVVTDFRNIAPSVTPSDVAIETNGNIIVAGQAVQLNPTAFLPGPGLFALARYTPTGALDGTFGTGGKVVTSFGKNATAGIAAIAIDSEGRLVAVGNVSSGSNAGSIAVARYLTH
jgi:uncharacterized delta-60 repeat protein